MNDFAKDIRRIRKEKGISAADLSKMCNVSSVYLCTVERGGTRPSVDMLNKIYLALGMGKFFASKQENTIC